MSVNIRIKQGVIKKNINSIIKYADLDYGTCDEYFRLVNKKTGTHTLLYDNKRFARGIDVSIDDNYINLDLSIPTTKEEINCLYRITEIICKKLLTKKFYKNDVEKTFEDINDCVIEDIDLCEKALIDIKEKLETDEYIQIFGIFNPISIGRKEIEEIDNNLNNLAKYLQDIQSIDAYYAVPKVFNIDNQLTGIYVIKDNVPSIVPLEPYIILNRIPNIKEWYVMFDEDNFINYNDFINNVDKSNYYDANHVIVELSESKIKDLLNEYKIIINLKKDE